MDTLIMLAVGKYGIGIDENGFPFFKSFYVNANVAVISFDHFWNFLL